MSKYDWTNVPGYIEFITTCKDGTVKGYCKPIQRGETWCSSYTINGVPPYRGDWKDSLEERPK